MSRTDAKTVVITDYDYGDVAIERAIIEGAGLQLTAAQCRTEAEVIEVAHHAMALLLAVGRKISAYDQATRTGTWRWQTGHPIHRLRGSLIGLLSFGAIARAIGARATGFGMRVITHDPYVSDADIAAHGATPVSFDQLLEQSDYLVVQAPLTQETHHLIGEAELRRMKPTAFLINTAR